MWSSYVFQTNSGVARTHPRHVAVQAKERELLEACGANPYQRALLLMQMAPLRAVRADQDAVLEVGRAAPAQARWAGGRIGRCLL